MATASRARLSFLVVALAACVLAAACTGVAEAQQQQRRNVVKRKQVPIAPLQRNVAMAAQLDTPAVPAVTVRPTANQPAILQLTKARFSYPSASQIDPSVPAVFDLLCYNGAPIGPTIRVQRGQAFGIRVINSLTGPPDPGPDPRDFMPFNGKPFPPWEVPEGFCTTNLHTHGLHVSPSGNSDNVYLHIDPGTSFDFYYQLPPNHVAGTFWFHPHKHGSVGYQLSNGVMGALIVEGVPGDSIPDLEDIPEIAAAREQILVFSYHTYSFYNDPVTNQPIGYIDPNAIYNVNPDGFLPTCDVGPPSTVTPNPGSAVVAVNGQLIPRFDAAPGELQRWRLVYGGWDVHQYFSWFEDAGAITPAPEIAMYEIALDGIATGKLTPVSTVQIAPGQRDDVLIKMPLLPQGVSQKTYYLVRQDWDNAVGGVGSAPPGSQDQYVVVAKLLVRGQPKNMALPDPNAVAQCRPFAPIGDDELVPATTSIVNHDGTGSLVFAQEDPPNPPSLLNTQYTINSLPFLHQNPIRLTLGTAQQWKLSAVTMPGNDPLFGGHPFHIHVNPFQVVAYIDASGNVTPMDEFRDTLFIPGTPKGKGGYIIRSRYQDLTGLSVLHCHILDHEDQGMMIPIKLVQPGDANKGGIDPSSLLAQADYPAPALALADVHGRRVDLKEFQGRNVVLVFFKGVRCMSCVTDVRALLREARARVGQAVEIVAVSSRKVDDLAKAVAILGVSPADRFHLLVDEKTASFSDYGCGSGTEARHGLFLVDANGRVRSRYIGETPYGDSEEVFDRLQLIAAAGRERPAIAASQPPAPPAELSGAGSDD
jgi:FtsP/CotA-like multicopper oxidase with cupredoxin domain/peroxiredoxin